MRKETRRILRRHRAQLRANLLRRRALTEDEVEEREVDDGVAAAGGDEPVK